MFESAYRRIFALMLMMFACLTATTTVSAAELDVTYVKTLGQTNTIGEPLKGSGCRQLAVDPQGNVLLGVGVGHPWTSLVKIGPNGRVIWETGCGGYANLPVAVAEDWVYAISPQILLRRYSLSTGKVDPTWGYEWPHDKPDLKGVRKFETATGIVVSADFIYISDAKAKLIRRFDRTTAAEKPFAAAPKIDEPLDIALAKGGNLLVLTSTAVIELDPEGKILRNPLFAGLTGPQGIEADQFTGEIFVSLAGTPEKPINQIWQYTADGKPTGAKLGRGGEFNGRWTPDAFGFTTGHADFTLDTSGGVWVNTGLGQLVHFTSAPDFRNDQAFYSLTDRAHDIAADSNLDVYVSVGQGQMKVSWTNELIWTSNVWPGGNPQLFPGSPIYGWPVYIGYAGTKAPIFYPMHARTYYTVSPETGQLVGEVHRSKLDVVTRMTATGDQLYMGGGEKDGWKLFSATHETLPNWTPYQTSPPNLTGVLLAVSRDKQRTYLFQNEKILCVDAKGGGWKASSPHAYGRYVQPVAFLNDDVIFMNDEEYELVARDARTGKILCKIGNKPEAGRQPIYRLMAVSVASKEGSNYLFVLCSHQIQVFEITLRK